MGMRPDYIFKFKIARAVIVLTNPDDEIYNTGRNIKAYTWEAQARSKA